MFKKVVLILLLLLIPHVYSACIQTDEFTKPPDSIENVADCTPQDLDGKDLSQIGGDVSAAIQNAYGVQSNFNLGPGATITGDSLNYQGSTLNLRSFSGSHDISTSGDRIVIDGQTQAKGAKIETISDTTLIIPEAEFIEAHGLNEKTELEGAKGYSEDNEGNVKADSAAEIKVGAGDSQVVMTNVNNFEQTGYQVSAESAGSIEYEGSQLLNVRDFLTGLDRSYTFDHADEFSVGSLRFRNLCKSKFDVKGNALINAHVCSDKDNNLFTLPNPLPMLGSQIYINANKSKTFDIEYSKLVVVDNVPKIALGFRLR